MSLFLLSFFGRDGSNRYNISDFGGFLIIEFGRDYSNLLFLSLDFLRFSGSGMVEVDKVSVGAFLDHQVAACVVLLIGLGLGFTLGVVGSLDEAVATGDDVDVVTG